MVNWMDVSGLAGEGGAQPEARAEASRALLEGLNVPQREAVVHGEGPLLILAGPGSGKTRVVTTRIAWLVLERGLRPEELLAITFTNKAAREMRERVERLLPTGGAWIGTFHGTCARILRREIEVLGERTRDFTIYDTSDRLQLIKTLVKEAGYDLTRFRPAAVGAWIGRAKNERRGGRWEEPEEEGGYEDELLARVLKRYEEALRAQNALDFDDLQLELLRIFELHPGVRDAWASRFRHVLVDEYQDTNHVQYLLARHLSGYHGNVAVCGDPDQSIYNWRGADVRNILEFERDYPEARVVKLEQNYRSKGNILRAAQAVIRNNRGRKEKELWSEGEEGELIALLECSDEEDEALAIAERIGGLVTEGVPLQEIAVFYRANYMQRALEARLRLAGLPYQVVGGLEFYQRREVKDLVSYLRLIVNPDDDVAFRRVVNVPRRGVGEQSLAKLAGWAADRRVSLSRAARSSEALAQIRGRAKAGIAAFGELLGRLEMARELPAADALERALDEIDVTAWLAELDDGSGVDRESNVDELRSHAAEYDKLQPEGRLRGFLQDIALVSEVDELDAESGRVTLMTLHSAKGLEFRAVFIAGLEEEILPHFRALAESQGDEGLEEERRLFYVGITRAMERLCLSHAQWRMRFGGDRGVAQPSRFLDEIPPELFEGGAPEPGADEMLGAFEAPAGTYAKLSVGDRVEHDHFGAGVVALLQGSGVNARATVRFERHGEKQLLLQYAKLEVRR